jgi:valyl-tRNA synthetase
MMQPELASKIKKQTEKEFSNGIPPFGTDALRLTFTALASFGRDIKFDLKRVEGYRNFCNKLWNASRFVLMKLESRSINFNATLSTPDNWILSRLQHTKISVEKHLSDYRLDLMSQTLYEFVWHDYCDWYLELSKPLLDNKETRPGCEATLFKVLSETLTLLHPIIPFITEEIFEQCRGLNNDKSERLITKPYPEIDETLISQKSELEIAWLQEFILGVRQIRGEMNIAPGKPLACFIQNLKTADEAYIKNNLSIISTLAKLESIKQLSENDSAPESATALVGEMKILIPLAGLVDKEQEILRLNKEIDKLIKHQQQLSGKLNNKKFISGAPKAVVEKEQSKLSSVEKTLADLELQLKKISSL